MKICHITSVHKRYDIRIFQKECVSAAENGVETILLVNDILGDETIKGVKIISTGYEEIKRYKRFIMARRQLFKKAIECDADVYHFHDPELLPLGMKLLSNKKKVVYDVHEDVPRQILSKPWIPKSFRKIISIIFECYENYCARKFNGIIVPTPHLLSRYKSKNNNVVQVSNFPILDEYKDEKIANTKSFDMCYIGGLTKNRGIEICARVAQNLGVKLELAGEFESDEFKNYILGNYNNVNYHGILERKEVINLLTSSKVGMVTLMPTPNHINAYPIKLFEYMAAGIPVIVSDFPLWKSIIADCKCGFCVNPKNLDEISAAVKKLFNNEQVAIDMGKNGMKAVIEKYNWNVEEKYLLEFYQSLSIDEVKNV